MNRVTFLFALTFVFGCAGKPKDPAPCPDTDEGAAPASSEAVCTHLAELGCTFEDVDSDVDGGMPIDPAATTACEAAYENWFVSTSNADFVRVTNCYIAATSCMAIEDCNRVCGESGGPVRTFDAGVSDSGAIVVDSGAPADSAVIDSQADDGGLQLDAGLHDAGAPDSGSMDLDAGVDSGPLDSGASDAGATSMDATIPDSGSSV